ncbi:hypothetical protein KSF_085650 [Reticulibacter mediterranei]|uniref:Uncharacterized protein n=2 Tax=Reticulibacter mediterranei TaxID=2778369 RepID=A0A8J3IXB9_9CHLR|nr:hypothetical protein KSF_085650 [Reticulibacter mediterranei]
MDQQEAERLVAATQRLHVAWLQVDGIVCHRENVNVTGGQGSQDYAPGNDMLGV